jgi:uncharacterized phage infection (PIP) family protein YhgE
MAYRSRILSIRKTGAMTLAILAISAYGFYSPGALAAPAEQPSPSGQDRAGENMPLPGAPAGGSLTELEKMELHYRRYTAAANGMAQMFKQLNQKIEDVSLAAKAWEVKNSSHNRRVLEDKLRQLESARTSYNLQYAQLQGQMQNEYRSYASIVHNLKSRYGEANAAKMEQADADAKPKQTRGKDAISGDSRTRESRSGEAKGKDSKNAGSRTTASKNKELRARDKQASDLESGDREAKDPRVIDIDTKELRARRDGITKQEPGPTLNAVP